MRKVLVIALRDYQAAVKTKAFIIGLLIMPLMMGGSILMQWLLRDFRDLKPKRFAVVDRTPGAALLPLIEKEVARYNQMLTDANGKQVRPEFLVEPVKPSESDPDAVKKQQFALSERIRKGKGDESLFGFLDVGADVLDYEVTNQKAAEESPVRYQSNRPTFMDFKQLCDGAVKEAVLRRRAERHHVSEAARQALQRPIPPVLAKGLSVRNPATDKIEDASKGSEIAPFAVPFVLLFLMFMVIMMGATPSMQGVVEEKMQRIAEVLLGSVQPFQLMLGKLLGMTAVSLTITAVYLGAAYGAAYYWELTEFVPGTLLLWFFIFQSLATLMYGALFIAIGAACSDMKETQNLLWPVMLLACMPMFVVVNVLQEPNSTVATGLSFFPFATPMLMIARLAVPPGIAWWQPLAGALLVLATTLLCVYAAGRIFRVGLLMQGKGAKLGDLFRWVFRG